MAIETNKAINKKFSYNQILTSSRLDEIMEEIANIRTAVIGDGILDIYWEADMTLSELSLETPHFPLPVVNERIHPGGGANVADNLAALGVKDVYMVSVIGKDWRGREFKRLLKEKGISSEYLIETDKAITPAYCKPLRQGVSDVVYEDPRLDFENRERLDREIEDRLKAEIKRVVNNIDAAAAADQLEYGVITDKIITEISAQGRQHLLVVDSRNAVHKFKNVIVKPNQIEAVNAVLDKGYSENSNPEDWKRAAKKLEEITEAPLIMTMGGRGAAWVENGEFREIPSVPVCGAQDPVGAGDCFLAAFISARAAGANPIEAIAVANLAAAVTVKKINITGNATREEIRQKYREVTEK